MKKISFALMLLMILAGSRKAAAQTGPWQMVQRMSMGINLGNTLEAPLEGQWAVAAQEFYFDDFKDAGLNCVRIPVRWQNHMSTEPPYTIESDFLARVEQVADWALERQFVTIINSHHDDWLYVNYPDSLERFATMWSQVASHFKNKSENLLFEIINEPYFELSKVQVDSHDSKQSHAQYQVQCTR
jgi:endoglucanase